MTPERVGALSLAERRGQAPEEHPGDGETEGPDIGARGFVQDGGWHAVEPRKGKRRGGGTTSHRGVLHPDEYVDLDDLRARISEHLGFTLDEVRSVYRQGPLSPAARALRDRIDARLLEVAQDGGLLVELGSALGWAVRADGHCRIVENALSRARKEAA